MSDPGTILDRCFEVFVDRLERRPDFSLPRHRLKQVGLVAPDFALFAVTIPTTGIYPGTPGQAQRGYNAATGGIVGQAMDLNVVLLREVFKVDNAGRVPMPDEIAKSAAVATTDARALDEVFRDAVNAKELFDPCSTYAFGGITFDGPDGGMLGTILNLSVSL